MSELNMTCWLGARVKCPRLGRQVLMYRFLHASRSRIVAALCAAVLIAAIPTQAHAQSDGGEIPAVMKAPVCCLYMWGPTWMWLTWVSDSDDVESDRAEVRYIRENAEDKSDEQWTVETADASWYHEINGLERDVRYVIQVRVGNEQGFGPWSDSLTERSRSRPQPIHRPTVTVGDGSLKVTWPQFSDAADIDYTGYYI
ncbi:fibronectin type III domain-containing protein [Candidatus Poriferisodalis sp.]|uniref:fibronectin type III domain-containing protein n=1 Tax=Candidatus Poriferisodalis sp. TaxID=3101277 RepID=UPI003C6FE9D2